MVLILADVIWRFNIDRVFQLIAIPSISPALGENPVPGEVRAAVAFDRHDQPSSSSPVSVIGLLIQGVTSRTLEITT